MIPLKTRGKSIGVTEAVLGPVSFGDPEHENKVNRGPRPERWRGTDRTAIYIPTAAWDSCVVPDWAAAVVTEHELEDHALSDSAQYQFSASASPRVPVVHGVRSTAHLAEGDIVALHPSGLVETLFRAGSQHNALFVTDRCNSNCLMCSQPPKDVDDIDALDWINRRLVPLIPKSTNEIGITGGEPTLLGRKLVALLELLRDELPRTAVHMLTNGREFAWPQPAAAVARVNHPDLVLGVPLYADHAALHDYVVQAHYAFSQTVLGLHNLGRAGVRVEIRVVLHALTYQRLPDLAEFIYRNLPFAEHVAFMGLEYTGYTPHNSQLLWIDPPDLARSLEEAVTYLDGFGMTVSVYNLQHCLLPPSLWPFMRPSISSWKREYLAECDVCAMRSSCGGVFGTSKRQAESIRAIPEPSAIPAEKA